MYSVLEDSAINQDELSVFGDTRNSTISGHRLLLLTMVTLALQDLNLEDQFKGLRKYFSVSKQAKREVPNMISAFEYLFLEETEDYFLSFSNFCYVFDVNEGLFRDLIKKALRKEGGLAYTEFCIWEVENEERYQQS